MMHHDGQLQRLILLVIYFGEDVSFFDGFSWFAEIENWSWVISLLQFRAENVP